ncbi:MAG: polyprenyl synthetase family protein [Candidatus Peribacteraceae bacterium]
MSLGLSFSAFAKRYRPVIETTLRSSAKTYLSGAPTTLRKAMAYSLLKSGKRLRPLIVLMASKACGGDPKKALPAACAVEAVHVFSLIHDDLPAMDDDDMRRGKPSNHKVFGEAEAILAGDALLALSFEIISSEISDPVAAAKCCRVLAKAAGATGICGGQSDDLRGSKDIDSVHRMKTAVLFEASAHLGALIGEGTAAQVRSLQAFGLSFGAAFQILDDLKDIHRKDKTSFVNRFGKQRSRKHLEELISTAVLVLKSFGPEADLLRSLAISIIELI